MKTYLTVLLVFTALLVNTSCKKDNSVNNTGPVAHAKKWLVKDMMANSDATHLYHTIFDYNDTGRIFKIDHAYSGTSNPADYVISDHYDIVYGTDGRISAIKRYQAPGFIVQYESNYKINTSPDDNDFAHAGKVTYSFNLHGRNELDEISVYVAPAYVSGLLYSTIRSYFYNDIGGVQSASASSDYWQNQDVWASYSVNPQPAIANPFQNGTTIEQRFLYKLFSSPIGEWDLLGPSWSNGILEAYSYSSGSKKAYSRFYNNYTLDNNKNVIKILQSYALDAPAFNTWVTATTNPYIFTYEQH